MTREEVRTHVLDIIGDIAPDEDLSGLDDQKPLREQIALDSMDFLDIVLELRKRHKVQIPEAEYQELRTMAGTIDYLLPKLSKTV